MVAKYKGLTYRGNAPLINVQMLPSMSYRVVVRRNSFYRFDPSEIPKTKEAIDYYKSLEPLGVHLVEITENELLVSESSMSDHGSVASEHYQEVELGKEIEIGVNSEELRKIEKDREDSQVVSQISSEVSDEALMEYLDSNFTEAQLQELANRFNIEVVDSSDSLSVQIVLSKNNELLKFISSQFI